MKMPTPRAVGALLTLAVPPLTGRLVELRIRSAWASIVGRDAARRTRPDGLSGGTLRVVVDNSPWLQELTLRASTLTADVRARFPQVHALRFVLGTIEREPTHAAVKPRRPMALTESDRAEIAAATEAISDVDVARAAERLLTTARRYPRTPAGPRGAV